MSKSKDSIFLNITELSKLHKYEIIERLDEHFGFDFNKDSYLSEKECTEIDLINIYRKCYFEYLQKEKNKKNELMDAEHTNKGKCA